MKMLCGSADGFSIFAMYSFKNRNTKESGNMSER